MVRTMGGDKSMAYPLAQHSSQIIQPLTKYQRHHATTISNFSSKLEPNKQNLFLPLWQIHHSTNCFFFFWSMDKIHTCSGTAFYIVGKTKREGKKVSYTSNHGHKTLTLPAWCQRSDTSYCPKHHPLQGNMILYNIAPMVDFWEHYWFHCRHRFQLSPAICFVSFSTHQQGDNPQKISPTMDKDERND